MKIRAGFVSNSSSSSFLVVCKDFKEFDKFKVFTDYAVFAEDYNDSSEEDARLWIEIEFKDLFYHLIYAAKHKNDSMHSFYSAMYNKNNIADLVDLAYVAADSAVDQEHFTSYMNKVHKYIWEDKVEEEERFVSNYIDYCQLADILMKQLKERGFTLRALTYEDHSDVGSFMEHHFMPFLSYNPKSEYKQVYRRNEH